MQILRLSLFAIILVCLVETSRSAAVIKCEADSDCPTSLVCKSQTEGPKICLMKPVTMDFGLRDTICIAVMFVGGALSAAGGVGGGGLFIPTLVLVMGISAPIATPLANSAVFGGAVANFVQNIVARHPKADRPLIDFWAGLMLEPNTLSGTVLGVLFYAMFPTWLIILLLLALFGFTTVKTIQKGVSVWKQETAEYQMAQKFINSAKSNEAAGQQPAVSVVSDAKSESEKTKLLQSTEGAPKKGYNQLSDEITEESKKEIVARIVDKERKVPWSSVAIQVGTWLFTLALQLLKGGEGARSLISVSRCDPIWWVLTALIFPVMACVTWLVGKRLVRMNEEKERAQYSFQKGDIRWTPQSILRIPIMCMVAGIMAGLLGVGGGLIKGPLLLELGVLPQVSAATAAYMILFTASTTVIQFLILGRLPWDYFILYTSIGLLSSVVGQTTVAYLIKKYKKTSLVIFAVGIVLLLSTLLMTVQGAIEAVTSASKSLSSLNFAPLCV